MKFLPAAIAALLVSLDNAAWEPQAEVDQALKEFKEAYAKAGQSAPARAEAARALGKAPHARTMRTLGVLLQGDGSGQETSEVRIAAAETIGKSFAAIPGAASPLAAVARLRDRKITDVRVASAKALGDLGRREGLSTLQGLADDKPFEIAREAVDGLGKIRDRSSVPLLIKLLREVERVPDAEIVPGLPFHGVGLGGPVLDDARAEQTERRAVLLEPVLSTLAKLTGQELRTYKDYQKWWSANGSKFTIPVKKQD